MIGVAQLTLCKGIGKIGSQNYRKAAFVTNLVSAYCSLCVDVLLSNFTMIFVVDLFLSPGASSNQGNDENASGDEGSEHPDGDENGTDDGEEEVVATKKDCCPIRPHLMAREILIFSCAYFGVLFAQYLADIALILANSFVLASSMARSTHSPVELFYSGVVLTLSFKLPRFINWFPQLFSGLITRFTKLLQNFSFNVVFVKALSVTCLGAQAPGEALTNIVLGCMIFLIFESHFFECIRVTFQGVSNATPRYLQTEHPRLARFAALALPGKFLGIAM